MFPLDSPLLTSFVLKTNRLKSVIIRSKGNSVARLAALWQVGSSAARDGN